MGSNWANIAALGSVPAAIIPLPVRNSSARSSGAISLASMRCDNAVCSCSRTNAETAAQPSGPVNNRSAVSISPRAGSQTKRATSGAPWAPPV